MTKCGFIWKIQTNELKVTFPIDLLGMIKGLQRAPLIVEVVFALIPLSQGVAGPDVVVKSFGSR